MRWRDERPEHSLYITGTLQAGGHVETASSGHYWSYAFHTSNRTQECYFKRTFKNLDAAKRAVERWLARRGK